MPYFVTRSPTQEEKDAYQWVEFTSDREYYGRPDDWDMYTHDHLGHALDSQNLTSDTYNILKTQAYHKENVTCNSC